MLSRAEIFKAVSLIGLVLAVGIGVHGAAKMEKAIFAGGCFWCMVHPFDELKGVVSVRAGYTGGTGADPNYDDYARKGHLEAVEITYEPSKISYTRLLDVFWRQIDPTDRGGQFVDRGPQYRSAIFYTTPEQKKLAEESKAALNSSGRYDKPVVTELIKAGIFYEAEAYHQDYYKKNPLKYKFYRLNSGRDRYLKKIWGKEPSVPYAPPPGGKYRKPSKDELKKMLTPMQYHVTQEGGTEPAFHNEYWENHDEGIYVDVVSGEPLFSSLDKFDSGTGWPSFTRPLEPGNVVRKEHKGIFGKRIEVRSRLADSHLGDLFYDGPPPTGIRYCLDSAALRFVPRAELAEKGYGQYQRLFEKEKAGVR